MPVVNMRIKNTVSRNGWYSFRLTVPDDLQKRIGKREITQSLNTRSPMEAEHLSKQLTTRWKHAFAGMRGNTKMLTEVDLNTKIQQFRSLMRERMDDVIPESFSRCNDKELSKIRGRIEQELDYLHEGSWSSVTCCGLLDGQHNLHDELKVWSYDQRLARRVVVTVEQALLTYYTAIQEELGLDIDIPVDFDRYRSPFVKKASSSIQPLAQNEKHPDSPPLMDILAEMLQSKKRALRTRTGLEADTKLFVEFFSDDSKSGIRDYTISDILAFRDKCLANLPSNASKKFPEATLKELLSMDSSVERLSATTVNNRMRSIRQLFSYAHKTGRIPINPCVTVALFDSTKNASETVDEEQSRTEKHAKTFTDDEIQKIMNEALYADQTRHPSRRWATLLIVHLGMRANECLQLRTCDINIDEGTLDIVSKHSTQRLKNKASERYLPLPKVITENREFIEYVKERQAEGTDIPLWANTTYTESNGYRRGWSRWFNALDVVSNGRDAHSLRHTAITRARQRKLPIEDVQRIVGHSTGGNSIHEGYVDRQALRESLRETVDAMSVIS